MKVVLDSYELLRTIGAHPEAFKSIDELVRKQASALLVAQLKHKSLELQRYREVRSAIGAETFELFMDTADEKMLKALAKKMDPHSPLVKAGGVSELRPHLVQLAEAKIQPTAKPARPGRAINDGVRRADAPRARTGDRPHAITTKPPGRR